MSILDTFFVLFDADTSKLDKGLGEADKKSTGLLDKLRNLDKESGKTGEAFHGMMGKLAGLAGVGLSIGALVHGIKETAAEYTELSKLAAQFRATVDEVDEFRDASELLGISQEKSTESLHSMERAIQDTAMGLGRAQKVFEELGIDVKDGAGKIKGTTVVIGELAEKFKEMDQGTRIRVMERLGLDPALLKLFNADLAALQKRMADIDRATGFDLNRAVKRANEYTKASKELSLELNTVKMYLGKLAEGFQIAALPWFTKAIQVAAGYVRSFVDFLMRHSHFVEGFMIAAAAAISYYLIPAAIRGALAVWAMVAPFALVGLAVAAVATVFALLYDDITNFLEGNDSLIGQLVAKYPAIGEAVAGIGAAFRFLLDVARSVMGFLLGMWDSPGEAFATFQSDLMDGLNALFAAFPGLQAGFDKVMGGVKFAGDAIVGVWDAIVAAVRLALGVLAAGAETVAGILGKVKGALGLSGAATPSAGASGGAPQARTPETDRQRTAAALAQGQQTLAVAAASPLTSTTSNAITNSSTQRGGDRNVTVEKVEVHTQATDAQGISRSIGQSLGSQMRQASSQFDDGVAA